MPTFGKSKGFKLKSGNKPSFKMMGASPVKQEKKGDEFGPIEKGQYPNLVQDISEVQKDDLGHFVTGLDDGSGPHYSSDTTRFPAGFQTWQGPIKEGDLLDETAHEAWSGVNVEQTDPDGSNPATGQRMMWDEKSGTYKPFKQQHKDASGNPTILNIPEVEIYGGPDSDSDDPKEKQRERERIRSIYEMSKKDLAKSMGKAALEAASERILPTVPLNQGVEPRPEWADTGKRGGKSTSRKRRKKDKGKDPEYNKPPTNDKIFRPSLPTNDSGIERRFGALPQKAKTEYEGRARINDEIGVANYKKGFYEKQGKRGTKGTAVTIVEGSDKARLERYGRGRKKHSDKEISAKRAGRIMRRKGKSHKGSLD